MPVISARHASLQLCSNAALGGFGCPPDVELEVVQDLDDLREDEVLGEDAEDIEDAVDVVDVVDFLVETSVVALSLSARA